MRKLTAAACALAMAAVAGCGNRMSPQGEALLLFAQTLFWIGRDDGTVFSLLERLEAQGFRVGKDVSTVQLFYDSLSLQPLPLRYSADYVRYLPNYKPVPYELVKFMNFEGRTDPKAIALPEAAGARLMILAADEGDGLYSLWLYSLDSDYLPVDKLCLYATSKEEKQLDDEALPEDKLIQDFTITSDYEIRLTDYDGRLKAESQKVYHLDMSRNFTEDANIEY